MDRNDLRNFIVEYAEVKEDVHYVVHSQEEEPDEYETEESKANTKRRAAWGALGGLLIGILFGGRMSGKWFQKWIVAPVLGSFVGAGIGQIADLVFKEFEPTERLQEYIARYQEAMDEKRYILADKWKAKMMVEYNKVPQSKRNQIDRQMKKLKSQGLMRKLKLGQ